MRFYKKAHKTTAMYQIWQEGIQPKLMQTDTMMISKIKYIHENPVKRGYVDESVHWRYSSARDYDGIESWLRLKSFGSMMNMYMHSHRGRWERARYPNK